MSFQRFWRRYMTRRAKFVVIVSIAYAIATFWLVGPHNVWGFIAAMLNGACFGMITYIIMYSFSRE